MKRLLLLSGKGGTGKTTTAAAFIHMSGARAYGDCDVDAPNLHLVTAPEELPRKKDFIGSNRARIDEQQCIGCGKCAESCRFGAVREENGHFRVDSFFCEGCGVCRYVCPADAVTMEPDVSGEQFLYTEGRTFSTARLKMGRGNSGKLVSAVKLDLFKNAPDTELCIVDGSPGIGCPVIASVSGMDLVLVVAEPSLSGISDLRRLCRTAAAFQTPMAVCVNKWDISPEKTEEIQSFCRENALPFVGKIPYDPAASQAINGGKSLAEIPCPAADALAEIYSRVRKLLALS